jgi:hypothetical protein
MNWNEQSRARNALSGRDLQCALLNAEVNVGEPEPFDLANPMAFYFCGEQEGCSTSWLGNHGRQTAFDDSAQRRFGEVHFRRRKH